MDLEQFWTLHSPPQPPSNRELDFASLIQVWTRLHVVPTFMPSTMATTTIIVPHSTTMATPPPSPSYHPIVANDDGVMCHLNIQLTPTFSGPLRHPPTFSSHSCFISLSPFLTICLQHSGLLLFLLYCVHLGAIVSDPVVFCRLLILLQHYS